MKQGRDTTQEERVQIAALAASDTQKIRSILPKIFWTGSFMPQYIQARSAQSGCLGADGKARALPRRIKSG